MLAPASVELQSHGAGWCLRISDEYVKCVATILPSGESYFGENTDWDAGGEPPQKP